jgi:hypothetical protein
MTSWVGALSLAAFSLRRGFGAARPFAPEPIETRSRQSSFIMSLRPPSGDQTLDNRLRLS